MKTEEIVQMESMTTTVLVESDSQIKTAQQVRFALSKTNTLQLIVKMYGFVFTLACVFCSIKNISVFASLLVIFFLS